MDSFVPNSLADGATGTITINEEMRGSYLNYAMSVIVARALPDARDGLKPVHRRILYAMHDMGLRPGASYKKSARLVGEVLGKYHPHGDQAVYDAMARMAQDFSLRYPLVDGQGNFGSQDGDKPAAMRYTEARMANIAGEMLADITMNTVDFAENYDQTQEEPTVLPARLPNLLLNGASGIAVGMATSIPPHNLRELADAIIYLIDNYSEIDAVTVDDLMQFIQGPDFPTGAEIVVGDELKEAYATGKGRVAVRSSADFEERGEGFSIVFTSIPYQVSKPAIIERIVSLVRDGRIEAISDLRDESDRRGLRLVVELKRHAQPQRVLNQLYKYTQLQSVYSIQMLALVNGEPRTLSLKRCLQVYIEHRYDVIVRRSEYDLERQRARAHVLSGLLKAVANIDRVIQTIRNSENVEAARSQLMAEFALDEIQTNAILDMQLRRLSALERQKLQEEYDAVLARIAYLVDLLESPQKILALIREDLCEIAEKYGDERKTSITYGNAYLDEADLYRRENVVISLTENGYIKRVAADDYKPQKRGGKGVKGIHFKGNGDRLKDIFFAHSHDTILFFSNKGKVYSRKSYDIPESKRERPGTLIQILLPLTSDEQITALLALPASAFDKNEAYCVIATRKGRIKRMDLSEYQYIRPSGLVLTRLLDDDTVGWVKATRGDQYIVMVSTDGKGILFPEDEVRVMGRLAGGVRGMRLREGDEIAGMDVLAEDDSHILVVTRNGYGKRTTIDDYSPQRRYGYGVITLKRAERKGPVVAVRCINEDDGIMLISQRGIVIRTDLSEIHAKGRNTEGVTVMDLEESDEVAGVAIMNDMADDIDEPDENGAGGLSAQNGNK